MLILASLQYCFQSILSPVVQEGVHGCKNHSQHIVFIYLIIYFLRLLFYESALYKCIFKRLMDANTEQEIEQSESADPRQGLFCVVYFVWRLCTDVLHNS